MNILAVVVVWATVVTPNVTARAEAHNLAKGLVEVSLSSANWSRSDTIAAISALATVLYFVATLVMVVLMMRANRIARRSAQDAAELARDALAETRRSNDLTQRSVEAAHIGVSIAQRQFDSAVLDYYLPVQAVVAAALGNVRNSRNLPLNVQYELTPPGFHEACAKAVMIGGGLQATLHVCEAMLNAAQAYRQDMIKATTVYDINDIAVDGNRQLMGVYLDGVEQSLQAVYAEISPIIDQLRISTGRRDVTLESLKPNADESAG